MKPLLASLVVALGVLAPTLTRAACPSPVAAAVKKAFPDGKLLSCEARDERGTAQFEAKVRHGAVTLEIDVSPTGQILQVEEPIAVSELPAAVARAFAARYPKAKATAAEKMTAGTHVRFEIAFLLDRARKEATFQGDGAFVEEE